MRQQLLTLDQLVQLMDPKLYLHLQSAESTNFFFFFRMLLVWFKREFEWVDVLRLWESLWTDYLSSNFHLFVALAILEKHRDVIMTHLKHFDEILKYSKFFNKNPAPDSLVGVTNFYLVNDLSNTIDLIPILVRAETLFRRFEKKVETIDKKYNFPSAPVRQRNVRSGSETQSQPPTSPSRDSINAASASGVRNGRTPQPQQSTTQESDVDKERIITPELRQLLSRKVYWLTPEEIREQASSVQPGAK